MQHSCYNPPVVGTCDVAQIKQHSSQQETLGYDWLVDAPDEAIVAKNRLSDMRLVANRLFVMSGIFSQSCEQAESVPATKGISRSGSRLVVEVRPYPEIKGASSELVCTPSRKGSRFDRVGAGLVTFERAHSGRSDRLSALL